MRARTLTLFVIALTLAGGTALLVRSFLAQRTVEAEATPLARPEAPQRSVLVARGAIARGQILKAQDFSWQVWPEGGIDKNYIQSGTRTPESFAGWVARDPFAAGEPISDAKIVSPGSRGFLAAVLGPGMRAVSVPVSATSGISGFVFPGDQVDILITHQLTGGDAQHRAAETVLHDVLFVRRHGEAAQAERQLADLGGDRDHLALLWCNLERRGMGDEGFAVLAVELLVDPDHPHVLQHGFCGLVLGLFLLREPVSDQDVDLVAREDKA